MGVTASATRRPARTSARLALPAARRLTPWPATALALPLVAALAVALALRSDHLAHPGLTAAYRATLIAVPCAIGLLWWRRRPESAAGPMLAALGLAALPSALQASDVPLAFAVGVLGASAWLVLLLACCVRFPYAHQRSPVARRLVAGFALALGLLILPPALLSPGLPVGRGSLMRCVPACPANPLDVAHAPGVVEATAYAGLALAIVSTAGLALFLAWRLRTAGRPQRRELAAVTATCFPIFPVLAMVCGARLVDAPPTTLSALGAAFGVAGLLVPLGFLIALLQAELFAAGALRRLLAELARRPGPARWRDAVASALDDPSLALGFWDPAHGTFRDAGGATVERPAAGDGRRWTAVEHEGRPVAAIATDAALGEHPELLGAAAQATLVAVRAGHLEGELRDSRRRLLEAGNAERRRIQRDLHDSAQQRLIALRVHLDLAAGDHDVLSPGHSVLGGLADEVDEALADLRRVAHGIYPPALERLGVRDALLAACRPAELPVSVRDEGLGRQSAAVESTLYFCCLEAIQNASKHAGPDARVRVRLGSAEHAVWFFVDDDGVGFDARVAGGVGLANLADRVEAMGGTLEVDSAPSRGTRVAGRFEA